MKRNLFVLPNSATDGEPDGDGSASSALDTVAGLSGAFDALDNNNPQDDAIIPLLVNTEFTELVADRKSVV